MKLKDNIKYFRKKAGMTQNDLAAKMKMKQYNISDYEIGRIEPSIDTLIKFANVFGVSIDFLVGKKKTPVMDDQEEKDEESILQEIKADPDLIQLYMLIGKKSGKDKKRLFQILKSAIDVFDIKDEDANEEKAEVEDGAIPLSGAPVLCKPDSAAVRAQKQ